MSKLPYSRLRDDNHTIFLAHEDVVAFTLTSQLPSMPSLDQRAFEVVIPKVPNTPPKIEAIKNVRHYHCLNSTTEEGTRSATKVDT